MFDLGDLNGFKNGSLKYFENGLKSMQIFHLNQMSSAVRSEASLNSQIDAVDEKYSHFEVLKFHKSNQALIKSKFRHRVDNPVS